MIRLIALDLDGTLLDPAGQVTQATRDAVAAARNAGVRVVLSTGRAVPEAVRYIREAGCDKLAVCLSGGVLADGETGYHIRRWDIPPASALPALELCLGRNIQLMVFAGEEILLDPYSRGRLLQSFPSPAFHESAIVTENPADYLRRHGLPLTKLYGYGNPAAHPLEELAALPGVNLTATSDLEFELVADGVHKGRALALLAMLYGVPLAQCAAVGDSPNDLGMLQAVGLPIAMGNAPDQVKAAARYVTGHNGQDGAAQAILHCLSLNSSH